MKQNLLTAAAMTVAAFFIGTPIAQAADITFGGQLRPRTEWNQQTNFTENAEAENFTSSRIRLHANVNVNDQTSAFIQLQSTRVWGADLATNGNANVGSGNAAATPNDGDASVGVHQAYFIQKNFFTLPIDAQVGRQEVVLDGHRLLGNTGWTQGAQTHDAVRLTHKRGDHTFLYVFSKVGEDGLTDGVDNDVNAHVGYANFQGILGGGLSLYAIYFDDSCGTSTQGCAAGRSDNASFWTLGLRQAGQLYGIDYRGEFYYQVGQARGAAGAITNTLGRGFTNSPSREAYMFGLRLGKSFKNTMWKPQITLWYDHLSGTDDDDLRNDEFGTFNTLFDTGHKFYGFMDLFLNANGANTDYLGLRDYAVKLAVTPRDNWKIKADWHYFQTAVNPDANNTVLSGAGFNNTQISDDSDLGHELDLTVVHKYNANTTISAGYSSFWAENLFHEIRATSATTGWSNQASWAYLMIDVKF